MIQIFIKHFLETNLSIGWWKNRKNVYFCQHLKLQTPFNKSKAFRLTGLKLLRTQFNHIWCLKWVIAKKKRCNLFINEISCSNSRTWQILGPLSSTSTSHSPNLWKSKNIFFKDNSLKLPKDWSFSHNHFPGGEEIWRDGDRAMSFSERRWIRID